MRRFFQFEPRPWNRIGQLSGTGLAFAVLTCTFAMNLSASDPQIAKEHATANPLFQLLTAPVTAPSDLLVPVMDHGIVLPAPILADGLSAAEQNKVLEQFATGRKTVSLPRLRAPKIAHDAIQLWDHARISELKKIQTTDMVTTVTAVVTAEGRLETVADREFLEQLIAVFQEKKREQDDEQAEQPEEESAEVEAETLKKAGIDPEQLANQDQERIRWVRGSLEETLKLSGVARSYWTQTKDSVLIAVAFDRRFDFDDKLRPAWEKYERKENGALALVEKGSSYCFGAYVKVTQLQGTDILFAELHAAVIQPHVWFKGRDTLSSKLSTLVNDEAKSLRRKLRK